MAVSPQATRLDTTDRVRWLRTLHNDERPRPELLRTVLELNEDGARLELEFARGRISMDLPEVPAQVLLVLLAPMAAHPGDLVSDAELLGRVVRARDDVTACEARRLVTRTRLALEESGVHGAQFVRRAPASAATRFAVPRGSEVSIRWRR